MSESIINFLNGEVKKYILSDIDRLEKIRPQGPEGLGSCAIPTAMFLFAIVDLFGFLVRNDSKNPKIDDTERNLRAIFSHPLGKFSPMYTQKVKTLVGLYRNGLMHQIFPKAAGIRKAGNTNSLFDRFDGLDHLNIDRFSSDIVTMIRTLGDSLSAPEWSNLKTQMSVRLDRIAKSDFKEMALKTKAEHNVTA